MKRSSIRFQLAHVHGLQGREPRRLVIVFYFNSRMYTDCKRTIGVS